MIEPANINELTEIMTFLNEIKEEMRNNNNPQWGLKKEDNPNILDEYLDYPNENLIKEDIEKQSLYKYIENNIIKGIVVISEDDGEYDEVIKNSKEPSYIMHRVAIPMKYRHEGIAYKLMEFGEKKAKENNIKVLKGDTEISNDKMNNLFIKLGYERLGTFSYEDYPGTYYYYEKEVK